MKNLQVLSSVKRQNNALFVSVSDVYFVQMRTLFHLLCQQIQLFLYYGFWAEEEKFCNLNLVTCQT